MSHVPQDSSKRRALLCLASLTALGLTLGGSGSVSAQADPVELEGSLRQGKEPEIARVSVSSAERQANRQTVDVAVSSRGRYVAFTSDATNLIRHDTNGQKDVFIRDRRHGTTRRVSRRPGGGQLKGGASVAAMSADGRYVLMTAEHCRFGQRGLLMNLRTTRSHWVTRPLNCGGDAAGGAALGISASGRFILFREKYLLYLRDRKLDRVRYLGNVGRFAHDSAMSTNGDHVASREDAEHGLMHIYLRSRPHLKKPRLISVSRFGGEANGRSFTPAVSHRGRYVAFKSRASNLVPGDRNGVADVFVRDRLKRRTSLVSIGPNHRQGNGASQAPSISAGGRFIAFTSAAENLVRGDSNGKVDVFLRDRRTGITTLISVGNREAPSHGVSRKPTVSPTNRHIAFVSRAGNLVRSDTNRVFDAFIAPVRLH